MSTILKWGGESKSRVLEDTSKKDEKEKAAQNELRPASLAVPLVIMILVGVIAIGVGAYQTFACESFLRISLAEIDTIPFWISELSLLSVLITSFFFICLTVSRATDKLWMYIGLIWLLLFHLGPHLLVVYNVGTTMTPPVDRIIKSYDIHLRVAPNDNMLPEWLEYIYDKHECCGIIHKQGHKEIMQDLGNHTNSSDPAEMKEKIYLISMDHTLREHTCNAVEDLISERTRSLTNSRSGSEAKGYGAILYRPSPNLKPNPNPNPNKTHNQKPKQHFSSPKVSKSILSQFQTDFNNFMDKLGHPSPSPPSDLGSNQYDGNEAACPNCGSDDPYPHPESDEPPNKNESLADEKIKLEGCAPAIEETYHSCISKCLHHAIFSALLGFVPFICFVVTLRKAIKAKRIAKLKERKQKVNLKRGVRFSEMDLKESESRISTSQFDQRSDRYNISNSEKSEASELDLSEYETPSEDSNSSLQSDLFGSQSSRRSRSQSIFSIRELEYPETTVEDRTNRNGPEQKAKIGGW